MIDVVICSRDISLCQLCNVWKKTPPSTHVFCNSGFIFVVCVAFFSPRWVACHIWTLWRHSEIFSEAVKEIKYRKCVNSKFQVLVSVPHNVNRAKGFWRACEVDLVVNSIFSVPQTDTMWTRTIREPSLCPASPRQRWACPSSCSPPPPAWSSSPASTPVTHTGERGHCTLRNFSLKHSRN